MSKNLSPPRTPTEKPQAGEPQFGALLMTEGGTQRSGPPPLFRGLTEGEKARVLESGKRKMLYRGAKLFTCVDRSEPHWLDCCGACCRRA